MPYQILMNEGAGPTGFSPNGLNMTTQTKYCQFSVTAPNIDAATPNAVVCEIQNLDYLTNQTLSLDRSADGSWHCRASTDINRAYLPEACR
jgi:type IV pilus assembly protein PilA